MYVLSRQNQLISYFLSSSQLSAPAISFSGLGSNCVNKLNVCTYLTTSHFLSPPTDIQLSTQTQELFQFPPSKRVVKIHSSVTFSGAKYASYDLAHSHHPSKYILAQQGACRVNKTLQTCYIGQMQWGFAAACGEQLLVVYASYQLGIYHDKAADL